MCCCFLKKKKSFYIISDLLICCCWTFSWFSFLFWCLFHVPSSPDHPTIQLTTFLPQNLSATRWVQLMCTFLSWRDCNSLSLSLYRSLSWHSAGCPLFGFPHVTPPYQWRGWNSNILLSQGHKSISRINNLLLPEVTQFAKSVGFGEGSQVQRQLHLMQLVATGNLDLSAILLFVYWFVRKLQSSLAKRNPIKSNCLLLFIFETHCLLPFFFINC